MKNLKEYSNKYNGIAYNLLRQRYVWRKAQGVWDKFPALFDRVWVIRWNDWHENYR